MWTIFRLSMVQMLRPKRLIILLVVAAVPVALSVVAAFIPPDGEDLIEFRDDVLMGPLVIAAVFVDSIPGRRGRSGLTALYSMPFVCAPP